MSKGETIMSVCKSCLVIWLFIVSGRAFGALEQLQQDISLGHHQGITGMMVSVQGQQLALTYAPGYSAEQLHDVRSVTKSITALLLGIALQQNKLDVQLPVYPFLPQQADKQQLKLLHLLTMQSGVACNDWQPASAGHEDKMYLQQGVWQGKQLLPSHWIQQMLIAYSKPDDRAEQYGYLWWRMQHQALPTIYYAHGNGGNFIFVVPKLAWLSVLPGLITTAKSNFYR